MRKYLFLYPAALYALFVSLCACSSQPNEGSASRPSQNIPSSGAYADMVLIPAGEFTMGEDSAEAKDDEKPPHNVYLSDFYIDRYEVTNRQYRKFIQATGHRVPYVEKQWAEPYNWHGSSYPEGKGDYPVVLISWDDAMAYARWAGKRLPSEAEWEKAARSGLVGKKYPWGDTIGFNRASYDKGLIRRRTLTPVGNYSPNSFGLYDVAGNVWEWCLDWYDEEYYRVSPGRNPDGAEKGLYRVLRGGSWINTEKYLRCSHRGKNVPDYRSYTLGFRCALSADGPAPGIDAETGKDSDNGLPDDVLKSL